MAEIAREMRIRGDWLRLTLSDRVFPDYPPLYFWFAGLFAKLGGMNEAMLRFPSTLAALGLLLSMWAWTRRRFDDRVALWSGVILGTTYFFAWQAVNMHVDMMFTFFLVGSILSFSVYRQEASARKRVILVVLSSLMMGLASLTKGLAGFVLPLGILGLDVLVRREWRGILPLFGVGVGAVLLFFGWSLLYARAAGEEYILYFVFRQNIERFLTGWSHGKPVYYYLINLWPNIFPWSFFFIPAVYSCWKGARRGRRASRSLLIWFGFIFLFFTVSHSKRNVYILPLYPAMAVIVGDWWVSLLRGGRSVRPMVAAAIPTALLFAIAGGGGIAFASIPSLSEKIPFPIPSLPWVVVALLFLSTAIFLLSMAFKQDAQRMGTGLAVFAGMIYLAIFGWLFPRLDDPLSAREDAEWIQTYIEGGEKVGIFGDHGRIPPESTALQYYSGHSVWELVDLEGIHQYLHQQPGDFILLREEELESFRRVVGLPVTIGRELIIGSDRLLAVRVALPAESD